tara:strand:+ start:44 stop:721 length:678 start_codon:yes stop_codon:yes gene_type:complete
VVNLIVTPSLISDISILNEELKIKSNIDKISFEEFISENSITLFENENYKFIYDKYVTFAELNKLNFNFKENYIFQIKKQNLSKFSNENSEINVHYIEPQKEKEIFPWDFTKILFSSKIQLQSEVVDHFCIDEYRFKQFLSYLHKELIRLKLTFLYDDDEIANVLVEKIDYKYQLARERKSKYNIEDIDKCLENIYKIEKLILESGFNSENAKRFIVSSKSLLQF